MTINTSNYIIAYDSSCVFCSKLISFFRFLGIFSSNQITAIQDLDVPNYDILDKSRLKNEIPIINLVNKKVFYGAEGIVALIIYKWPTTKHLSNLILILFTPLYLLISYNRKLIFNKTLNFCSSPFCEPTFNIKYRTSYIAITNILSFLIIYKLLNYYNLAIYFKYLLVFVILTTLLLFLTLKLKKGVEVSFEIIGHCSTLLLFGSVMILPILLINKLVILPDFIIFIYLLIVLVFSIISLKSRTSSLLFS
jgi:predicted DCC family thiol-disulfide oxidoreductase YuxK